MLLVRERPVSNVNVNRMPKPIFVPPILAEMIKSLYDLKNSSAVQKGPHAR